MKGFIQQRENLVAILLILLFVLISYLSMKNLSITADESKHYKYGTKILDRDASRLVNKKGLVDDSKMPFSALNAFPAKMANYIPGENVKFLPYGGIREFLNKFSTARLMTIFFSALVAWLVFYWSRSLYGFIPAVISLLLYIFDPNIIAHSQLVTTDLYGVGMTLFCFYYLWKFSKDKSPRTGFILAIMLGLSQLAKYSSLYLFPLCLFMLVLFDCFSSDSFIGRRKVAAYLGKILYWIGIVSIVSLIVINLGYWFNRSFTRLKDYNFQSEELKTIQETNSGLGNIPIPVPYPYLEGIDLVRYRERMGVGYGRIYLLGNLRDGDGFTGYFFVASLLKVPVATQILLLLALVTFVKDKKRQERLWDDEIFLLLPVLFFIIYLNFFYNTQIGIRHYLVIYPLAYIFSGQLFKNWKGFTKARQIAFIVLGGYLIVSVLSYYPHYLAYFNEFVWDRKTAYKYLADSNLDWDQGKNYLAEYREKHPDILYAPDSISAGQIIVPVNYLVGVFGEIEDFQWLRENFEPTGTIAYSYLIYDISQQDVDVLCHSQYVCP